MARSFSNIIARLTLALVGAIALLLAGCAGPSESLRATSVEASRTTPPIDVNRIRRTAEVTVPADTLEYARSEASEFQTKLLSDGKLSPAEYESAKLAEIGCLRERGLEIDRQPRLNGLFLYFYMILATAEQGSSAPAIIQECADEFSDAISIAWAHASVELTEEVRVESRRWMRRCIDAAGLRVEDEPRSSENPEVRAAFKKCEDDMQALFDFEGVSFGVEGDGGGRR